MRCRALVLSLAAVLMWGCGGTWGAGGVAPPRSTGLSLSDALAMSSSPDSGPDDLVHHAVALLEHGHWARADRLVRRALVRSPRHLSALIVDARIAVARGDLDHAWTRLDDAITLEPAVLRDSNVSSEFVALTIQLSRELRRTRGYGDALALFERLRQPPFVEASSLSAELSRELNAELVTLSQTFIRRGLAHQAKRALRLAADRGASMEEENAAFVRAQIDVSSDETSLSVERWARADPEKRWLRAARFSESIGHDNEALEAYRSAAAAVPTSAAAWRGLARACLKTQDVACAQEAYGRAAACSETIADQSDILLTGARVLRDVHGTEASLPLFQAAVALEPARWAVVSEAASALGVHMRHQALERILVAHVGAAADPDAALSRSMNLLHARGWTASSRRLAELLSATPTPPRSLPLALARNLPIHAVHDVERARLIKEALATTDDELNMQMEVARHWLAIGRGQAAIRHLGRAQVLDPENPHALRMLASGSTGAPSSERQAARETVLANARTEQRSAIVMANWETEEGRPGKALEILEPWTARGDVTLTRSFHEARYRAALRTREQGYGVASTALRAWLSRSPPDERSEALEEVLLRTAGVTAMRPLRIEVLTALTKSRPKDVRARRVLANELLAAGRIDQSVAAWLKVIEHCEDPQNERLEAGQALEMAGHQDAAASILDDLAPARISEVRTHRKLAGFFAQRGEIERARLHHEIVLRSSRLPRHPQILRNITDFMLRHRQPEGAREAVDQRLELNPRNRDTLIDHVKVALLGGDSEQITAAEQRLMGIVPRATKKHAWQRLSAAYEEEGDLERAALAMEASLRIQSPGAMVSVFKRLGSLYRRLGEPRRLLDAASWVSAHSGKSVSTVAAVIKELESSGLFEEAALLLGDITGHLTGDVRLMELALENAALRGRLDEADAWATRWLTASGHRPQTWTKIAQIWANTGHPERGRLVLERAVETLPKESELHLAHGRALWILGDRVAAEGSLLKAVTLESSPREMLKKIASWMRGTDNDWLASFLARATTVLDARHEPGLLRIRVQLDTGDIQGAEASILRHLGADQRGHLEVANLARQSGWPALALRYYERALSRPNVGGSKFPVATWMDLLVRQGHAESLDPLLSTVVSNARERELAMLEAARGQVNLGRRARAIEWIDRSERLRPSPELSELRGRVLLETEAADAAAAAFERSIRSRQIGVTTTRRSRARRRGSVQVRVLGSVASSYENRGLYLEGARFMSRFMSGETPSPNLAGIEATLLVRGGHIPQALETLDTLPPWVGKATPVTQIWRDLAAALADRGLRSKAIEVLGRILESKYQVDLAHTHLRYLIEARRSVAAWRAARVLLARQVPDGPLKIAKMAMEGQLPRLAELLRAWVARYGSPPTRAAVDALLRRHGMEDGETDATIPRPEPNARQDVLGALRQEARSLVKQEDESSALARALEALRLEPSDRPTQLLALRLAGFLEDESALREVIESLTRTLRSERAALEFTVQHLSASGLEALALSAQERLVELQPGLAGPTLAALRLALKIGAVDRADGWLAQAKQRWGHEVDLRLTLARICRRHGRHAQAYELATLQEDTRGSRAWLSAVERAHSSRALGRSEEAIEALARGIPLASDPVAARVAAVDLVNQWGDDEVDSSRLLANPGDPHESAPANRLQRVSSLWRQGDARASEASGQFESLLADKVLTPTGIADAMTRAASAAQVDALDTLVEEMTLHIGAPEAHRVAGHRVILALDRAAVGLGRPLSPAHTARMAQYARETLTKALGTSHRPGAGHVSVIGRSYEILGQPAIALSLYEDATLDMPWESSARNNWAYALAEHDETLSLALSLVTDAQRRREEPVASFLDTQAWVLYKLGRFDEAAIVMKRALLHAVDAQHLTPEGRVEMLYHEGRILEASGARREARAAFGACAAVGGGEPYGQRCQRALEERTPLTVPSAEPSE